MAISHNTTEARDIIYGQVKALFDSLVLDTIGFPPGTSLTVIYDDQSEGTVPPNEAVLPWVKVTLSHVASTQEAMGETGQGLFQPIGLLVAQIYTKRGMGRTLAYALGDPLVDNLRASHPSGVRYNNVAIRDVGPSGPWTQVNVRAEFEYDTLA